jgi:hypothetical protein
MKRSEMVELIASVHADWQMLTANETMSFPDVEFAEFLLTNIENAGMLPPPSSFNIHNIDSYVDKQLGFVAEVTYDFPINEDNSVNLWEPEDDLP